MISYYNNQKDIEQLYNMRDIDICRIQNIDAVRVEVKGSLDGENFVSIGGTALKDNAFVPEIKSAGIYSFDIKGIEFIKVIKNETRVKVIVEGIN